MGRRDFHPHGAWLSLVERQLWELNVASSNLAAPTIFFFKIHSGEV